MTSPPLFYSTLAVTASPATDAEIVIATLTGVCTKYAGQTIKLTAAANLTPDVDATAIVARIRRASLTGTVVGGPVSISGTAVDDATSMNLGVDGSDSPGDVSGGVYVLTIACTDANSAGVTNAVSLVARVD